MGISNCHQCVILIVVGRTVDYNTSAWAVAFDKLAAFISLCISPCVWPLIVLILVFAFIRPISVFLNRVAKDANSIEIAGNKVSLEHISEAVVEREILTTAIAIAVSDTDRDNQSKELELLGIMASQMAEEWDDLEPKDKDRILREAVKISLADKKLADIEYARLKKRAEKLGNVEKLDEMIIDVCIDFPREELELPIKILQKFDDRISNLLPT